MVNMVYQISDQIASGVFTSWSHIGKATSSRIWLSNSVTNISSRASRDAKNKGDSSKTSWNCHSGQLVLCRQDLWCDTLVDILIARWVAAYNSLEKRSSQRRFKATACLLKCPGFHLLWRRGDIATPRSVSWISCAFISPVTGVLSLLSQAQHQV